MEKVKVVKAVPGLLKVGDVLVSSAPGHDFNLEEKNFNSTRFVSLDYNTVSANIPTVFVFDLSDFEGECMDCEACDCEPCFDCDEYDVAQVRTNSEIAERYEFYQDCFDNAKPYSEQQVVYQNLMWFIEWLYGHKELV